MPRSSAKTTSRRRPASTGGFEISPDCPRLVPTGGGAYAYVRGASGRTVHVRVGTPAYLAALDELRAEVSGPSAERLAADVAALAAQFPDAGWDAVTPEAHDTDADASDADAALEPAGV